MFFHTLGNCGIRFSKKTFCNAVIGDAWSKYWPSRCLWSNPCFAHGLLTPGFWLLAPLFFLRSFAAIQVDTLQRLLDKVLGFNAVSRIPTALVTSRNG